MLGLIVEEIIERSEKNLEELKELKKALKVKNKHLLIISNIIIW